MNKQEFLRKAENCEFSYVLTENGKAYYLVKDSDDKYWALLGIFNKEYIDECIKDGLEKVEIFKLSDSVSSQLFSHTLEELNNLDLIHSCKELAYV